MPSVVSIVGRSGSGKTTLLEKVVSELTGRGYRVATIKHTMRAVPPDESGKDTWRHVQAGSKVTALVAEGSIRVVKPVEAAVSLDEVVRLIGDDCDIIFTEGFKEGNAPKIEVHRREVAPPLTGLKKLFAIATDEPLDTKVRQFSLDDVKPIADLVAAGFIEPQLERLTLYANGKPVALSAFPREVIRNVLLAMAASLKGVGEITSLDISLRCPSGRD